MPDARHPLRLGCWRMGFLACATAAVPSLGTVGRARLDPFGLARVLGPDPQVFSGGKTWQSRITRSVFRLRPAPMTRDFRPLPTPSACAHERSHAAARRRSPQSQREHPAQAVQPFRPAALAAYARQGPLAPVHLVPPGELVPGIRRRRQRQVVGFDQGQLQLPQPRLRAHVRSGGLPPRPAPPVPAATATMSGAATPNAAASPGAASAVTTCCPYCVCCPSGAASPLSCQCASSASQPLLPGPGCAEPLRLATAASWVLMAASSSSRWRRSCRCHVLTPHGRCSALRLAGRRVSGSPLQQEPPQRIVHPPRQPAGVHRCRHRLAVDPQHRRRSRPALLAAPSRAAAPAAAPPARAPDWGPVSPSRRYLRSFPYPAIPAASPVEPALLWGGWPPVPGRVVAIRWPLPGKDVATRLGTSPSYPGACSNGSQA